MVKKGIISAVLGDGYTATVTPHDGGIVSPALVVPAHLVGIVPAGTEVWYTLGSDNTGIILQRFDGKLSPDAIGGNLTAYSDGDAIIISTRKGE